MAVVEEVSPGAMEVATRPFGEHLRDWRRRRRMSQLDLALDAEISARHLSFVETGRARPSREMVLHLCERLAVPLRERNLLLMSAGHAPMFPARALDDPMLAPARRTVDMVLAGASPTRRWPSTGTGRSSPQTGQFRRCSRALMRSSWRRR